MPKIGLFVPCYMATLRPADAGHAARVLRALGDEVVPIEGRCCGQPAFNSGFRAEAKTVGRELLRTAQPFAAIVAPSGSCTSMVQHYLPGLWEGDQRLGATSIANRFHEFSDYVANHDSVASLCLKLPGVVTYHDSCHTRRELGLTGTVLRLLERVEGLEVRRLRYEEECCGFGGTFAVKQPEVSAALLSAKLGDIAGTGAQVAVSADLSCLAHLQSGADGMGMTLETWTVAELLSRALP